MGEPFDIGHSGGNPPGMYPPAIVKIIPSPRPEDDSPAANPLPGYHELLNALCTRFRVPGAVTFSEAMEWIDTHHDRRGPDE